jgi:hypothetical protein
MILRSILVVRAGAASSLIMQEQSINSAFRAVSVAKCLKIRHFGGRTMKDRQKTDAAVHP